MTTFSFQWMACQLFSTKPFPEPDLLKVEQSWKNVQWSSIQNKTYVKEMYTIMFCTNLAILSFKNTIHTCHMPLRHRHDWQSGSVTMERDWPVALNNVGLNTSYPCYPLISFIFVCLPYTVKNQWIDLIFYWDKPGFNLDANTKLGM